jgi:hypothetical protein
MGIAFSYWLLREHSTAYKYSEENGCNLSFAIILPNLAVLWPSAVSRGTNAGAIEINVASSSPLEFSIAFIIQCTLRVKLYL